MSVTLQQCLTTIAKQLTRIKCHSSMTLHLSYVQQQVPYKSTGAGMSTDLYLLPLEDSEGPDEAAKKLRNLAATGAGEQLMAQLAAIIKRVDQRYREAEKDFTKLAAFFKIDEDEARKRFGAIQLDGPPEDRLAQFEICNTHVAIHWYSGTTKRDMAAYLEALCTESGYAIFDPQSHVVFRFGDELWGEFIGAD